MSSVALFNELRIGGLTLPNRIVVSPMAQYAARNGIPQAWHLQHWGSLVASGPALVIIEATSVDPCGYGTSTCVALHSDEHEVGLKSAIDMVRAVADTKLGIQIGHNGRKASTALPWEGGKPLGASQGGWTTHAPSAVPFGNGWPTPAAMDVADIDTVRNAFIAGAERAARIGFDLVEIHGAHGYLLHSFMSPISNRRTDDYGGSFDNRIRVAREIVAGMRAVLPYPRALGIRLNACDWVEGGLDIEETTRIVSALKEAGCDYVAVSAGAISSEARIPAAPGYLAPYSEHIRKRAGIATMVTGLIYDPVLANAIVASGQADAVAIARAFLDDPRWVWRAAEKLGVPMQYPNAYERAHPSKWNGAVNLRSATAAA